MITKETGRLKDKLDARRAQFSRTAPQAKIDAYEKGVQAVLESGIVSRAKGIGDSAPDFTLINALGQPVSLSNALKGGPVVLTWYRGGWCPYCNLALRSLQHYLPAFTQAKASLLALTPELPDRSLSTKEKLELQFEILSDVGNQVAQSYGLVFKLTPEVARYYNETFDLKSYNGTSSEELPLAATYLIDTNRTIRYAFLDADYRNRAEPIDVLNALKALS